MATPGTTCEHGLGGPGTSQNQAPAMSIFNKEWLREGLGHMYYCRGALGSLPPRPHTFRARLGMLLVNVVRRMLFWLLPQIDAFFAAAIEMARRQSACLEQMATAVAQIDERVSLTATELRQWQGSLAGLEMRLSGDARRRPARTHEPPWMDEIRQARRALEEQHARTEALLWLESVKCRAKN